MRVPHPDGEGTVAATFVVEAETRAKPRFGWVRYLEGPMEGLTARIAVGDIVVGEQDD